MLQTAEAGLVFASVEHGQQAGLFVQVDRLSKGSFAIDVVTETGEFILDGRVSRKTVHYEQRAGQLHSGGDTLSRAELLQEISQSHTLDQLFSEPLMHKLAEEVARQGKAYRGIPHAFSAPASKQHFRTPLLLPIPTIRGLMSL